MLGRRWAAQAQEAVVGVATRHQITRNWRTRPAPSAYQTFMPFRSLPLTYASWSGLNVLQAWDKRYTLLRPAQPQRYTPVPGGRTVKHGYDFTQRLIPSAGIQRWLRPR